MKTINKWALGIALMAGLASCEMKDELLGDSVLSGDTGFLALKWLPLMYQQKVQQTR